MPRCKVERTSRTAFTRWGLRTLVVGALAGAAWLLTGAAAQAADHDPTFVGATPGSSLTDAAETGGTTEPAVTGTLQAAAQPLDPTRPASAIDQQDRALTRPVATGAETTGEVARQQRAADLAPAVVDRVDREIIGTLRLTGGPVDSRLAPVTAPVTAALVPGTRGIRAVRLLAEPTPHVAAPARTADRPETSAAVGTAVDRGVARINGSSRTTGFVSRRHPAVTDWATGTRRAAARPAAAPETIRKASGDDGPAPLRVHLGGAGGLVTCGSQAPTDGGSAAFLPAAMAAGTVAVHRMPSPDDAEIRRNNAEAPTVSPD